MAGSILGNRVVRTEDPELLTVGGRYVADLELDGKLHLALVRSPVAHGAIAGIDVSEAAAAPGVVAVLTAEELGIPAHHGFVKVADDFARPPLAVDHVRFVGEPVVAIVAETLTAATDAADLVYVDYEPLPAVVDPEAAFEQAPIFPGHGSNVALAVTIDPHDPDFFADADVVVRGRYENQRLAPVPLEPDSFAAVPGGEGTLTVYVATQGPHGVRDQLAGVLGLDPERVRAIAPHVGGGFGAKIGLHSEHAIAAKLALRLRRPVTWTETRSENMLALPHSRGQIQYVELGLREDGSFTGLRVRAVGDGGAYPGLGAMLPAGSRRMGNGTYDFPKIAYDVVVAATTTTPMGAYRGAGRP